MSSAKQNAGDLEVRATGLGSQTSELQESFCRPAVAEPALSSTKAVFTLTQNILGAGVLALPFAVKSAGVVAGCAVLGLIFLLTILSMGALVLLGTNIGEFSYKGLALRTLGPRWALFFEIWVLIYTLGVCVGYPILLGDFVSAVLKYMGAGAWCTPALCMSVVVAVVCWPLSCSPTLGALGRLSILGVFFVASTVVICIIRVADGSYSGQSQGGMVAFNAKDFGSCFPIMAGALGAHFNIPVLYKEVAPMAGVGGYSSSTEGKAALRRMFGVIAVSLSICTAIYTAVAVLVYSIFGPAVEADFTKNFRNNDVLLIVVRCAMSFSICVCFPLVMFSARTAMFNLFFKPRGWELTTTFRIALTSVMVVFCWGVALACGGQLDIVLALNGSVFGTPVCYVAPCIMYLFLPRASRKTAWSICCLFCALLGVFFGIYGVVTIVSAHSKSKESVTSFFFVPSHLP